MEKIKKLQKEIKKLRLGAVLISKPENVFYLCGFTGSSGQLIVTPKKAVLVTDFRYFAVAKKQLTKGVSIFDYKDDIKKITGNIKAVGYEECYITVLKLRNLKKLLSGIKLKPVNYLVEKMRAIKDENEIAIMKKAVKITEECLKIFVKTIKTGQSEDEMEWNMLSIAHKLGADGFSFDPIICFGKETAEVHHQKGENILKKGDKILIDFGLKYKNYMTDMTRVFYQKQGKGKGEGNDIEHKIYSTVLEANKKAIESIRVGMKLKNLDKKARKIIEKAGYGKYFGHALGHGIGLKVHESPNVSEKSEDVVRAGMVFTIEPGIYIEGKGGVRIEDMVYINKKGKAEVLTKFPKDIIDRKY
jgi:Xaa-Pro aminopeptidase